jgi:hypothetical protein
MAGVMPAGQPLVDLFAVASETTRNSGSGLLLVGNTIYNF